MRKAGEPESGVADLGWIEPVCSSTSAVTIALPQDCELPGDVVDTLNRLPPLNNLRMFARVCRCFNTLMAFIDQIFNHGTFDGRLRECMYLRRSYIEGLYYEFRHNALFAENLGMTDEKIKALTREGEVTALLSAARPLQLDEGE